MTTGRWRFRSSSAAVLGRTPYIGQTIRERLPARHLLSYLQAVIRVYNRTSRRDNIHKQRIKVLVATLGAEEFARQVEAEWSATDKGRRRPCRIWSLPASAPPSPRAASTLSRCVSAAFEAAKAESRAFARFARHNVKPHKQPGYAIVDVSAEGDR